MEDFCKIPWRGGVVQPQQVPQTPFLSPRGLFSFLPQAPVPILSDFEYALKVHLYEGTGDLSANSALQKLRLPQEHRFFGQQEVIVGQQVVRGQYCSVEQLQTRTQTRTLQNNLRNTSDNSQLSQMKGVCGSLNSSGKGEASVASRRTNSSDSSHLAEESCSALPKHVDATKKPKTVEKADLKQEQAALHSSGRPSAKIIMPPLARLCAYNFFFRHERDRIVENKDDQPYDLSDRHKIILLHKHLCRNRTAKRKHRKTHGKVSFTALSVTIGNRWKALPQTVRKFYQELADIDADRFQEETAEYREFMKNLVTEEAKTAIRLKQEQDEGGD